MKKTMYLVQYKGGEYDDYYENQIFVTENIELAESYCKRFNELLEKWKQIWSSIRYDDEGIKNDWSFDRYYDIMQIRICFYSIIEVR